MKRRLQTRDRTELQETGSGTEPDDGGGITIKETGRSPTWLVEQFVQRIAQPGTRAMFIGPDNQNGGWASLADAIRSGQSFCITLRHDVVALDADGEESGRAVEQELVPYLRDSGLRPVLMRSGRAFHRHLFVRVADPQKRERMIKWARRRGIDVRNPSPIRPPPSARAAGSASPPEYGRGRAGSAGAFDEPSSRLA